MGKAVNRGLGRFKLTGYTLGPAADKLGGHLDTLERILETLQQGLGGQGHLGEVLRSYLSLLPPWNREKPRNEDLMAPSLPRAEIMYTRRPRHPCPYAPTELSQAARRGYCRRRGYDCTQIQDERIRTYCILSAIGAATMKSVWKFRRGGQLADPGPGYHTWILGLPRSAERKIGKDKRRTGYHVVRRGKGWNLPPEYENTRDPPTSLIEKTLRHQSIIMLFPQANGLLYLVATPSYGSLAEILEDDPVKPGKALYHAGLHNNISHWAKVTHIASTKKSNKFNDTFGIITPPSQPSKPRRYNRDRFNTAREAYNAALSWLRTLLDLNRQYRISG